MDTVNKIAITCRILIAVVWCTEFQAIASSRVSPESGAIGNVWTAMRIYQMRTGHVATNWDQINEDIDLDAINREALINSPAYPLQEHYVFVTNRISVPGDEMGNLILIRTGPLKQVDGDVEREGRYLISRYGDQPKLTWMAETNVQKMLADAGVTDLPNPEPWIPKPRPVRNPPSTNSTQSAPPIRAAHLVSNEVGIAEATTHPQQGSQPADAPSESAVSRTDQQTTRSPSIKFALTILLGAVAAFAFVLVRRR